MKSLKNGQMEVIAHAEIEIVSEKGKRDMGKENKKANQIVFNIRKKVLIISSYKNGMS